MSELLIACIVFNVINKGIREAVVIQRQKAGLPPLSPSPSAPPSPIR